MVGDGSNIEWTDATWNPIRGCSRVSDGCRNCYAEKVAARFSGAGMPYEGLITIGEKGPRWNGTTRFVLEHLGDPLRWKKPRKIFVNSMSDLFHESLTNEQIAVVFGVMAACPQHTFQVLTKRPKRMREWFDWADKHGGGYDVMRQDMPNALLACAWEACCGECLGDVEIERFDLPDPETFGTTWPLPNVWLGVSVEDQKTADERVPLLYHTPASKRFVSYEPALGPVDWRQPFARYADGTVFDGVFDGRRTWLDMVDWLIVGGESGPGARTFDLAWARSVLEQAQGTDCAVFIKQLGARPYDSERLVGIDAPEDARTPTKTDGAGGKMSLGNLVLLRDRKGGDMQEWPPELRVRQFPEVRVCPPCEGHGHVLPFGMSQTVPCSRCKGSGRIG